MYAFSLPISPFSDDLDEIDENKNVVHRADQQESTSILPVMDAFARLVWIDPNSPTLKRRGVAEERTQEADHDVAGNEEEDRDEVRYDQGEEEYDGHEMEGERDLKDGSSTYEQDHRTESQGNRRNPFFSKHRILYPFYANYCPFQKFIKRLGPSLHIVQIASYEEMNPIASLPSLVIYILVIFHCLIMFNNNV